MGFLRQEVSCSQSSEERVWNYIDREDKTSQLLSPLHSWNPRCLGLGPAAVEILAVKCHSSGQLEAECGGDLLPSLGPQHQTQAANAPPASVSSHPARQSPPGNPGPRTAQGGGMGQARVKETEEPQWQLPQRCRSGEKQGAAK